MKKVLLYLLIVGIAAISCEEKKAEEEEVKISNTLEMDGSSFVVSSAIMIGVSMGDDGHTGISLVSGSGLSATTLTIDVESFTKETIVGEYAYPKVEEKKLLDDWLTNYSVFESGSANSFNLESGEVLITHNDGNNYTIVINLTMDNGVSFIGKYTGEFQVMFNNL